MSYATLDVDAAKQADQQGRFINSTGKYKGKFTKAEALTADSGTTGISFTFESDDKRIANFSIYIQKSNGEKLYAYKTLNSIMACLRMKSVSMPVTRKTSKYDFKLRKEVEYDAPLLIDLMNKPIGIVLQSCEYEKEKDRVPTGGYAWKIEIKGAFEHSTEFTAAEILDRATVPAALSQIIAVLEDRPVKNKLHKKSESSNRTIIDDLNDDIPF